MKEITYRNLILLKELDAKLGNHDLNINLHFRILDNEGVTLSYV